jgi:hypothetical protein
MSENTTSVPNQIRLWLDRNPGFHKTADIATALGVESKSVSSALSRLVKAGRVLKENGAYADPNAPEPVAAPEAETAPETPEETVSDETPAEVSPAPEKAGDDADEPVFYEYIDFPGNYSISMAPFAVEIAEAAGVPAKVETFAGKLTRRVHFGGDDMAKTQAVSALVMEEAKSAMDVLHAWQKEHIEERRGLTDMQKYLQHRGILEAHGHAVAKRVREEGI